MAVIPVVLDPHLRVREVKTASEEGTASIRVTLSTPVDAGEETAGASTPNRKYNARWPPMAGNWC